MTKIRTCLRGTLLLLALACALAGCVEHSREQFVSAEIAGQSRTFDAVVSANDPPKEALVHFVTVYGQEAGGPEAPSMSFQLVSPAGARLGTYHSDRDEMHGTYHPGGSATVFQGNGSYGTHFTMTVTAIDDDGVEGTFSGLLQRWDGSDNPPMMTVTNGRFSASYNKY